MVNGTTEIVELGIKEFHRIGSRQGALDGGKQNLNFRVFRIYIEIKLREPKGMLIIIFSLEYELI